MSTKHRWAPKLLKHYCLPLPSSINSCDLHPNTISSFCKKNIKFVSLSIILFLIILSPCVLITYQSHSLSTTSCTSNNYRQLLSSNKECFPKAANPPYIAIFCAIGVLYMFVALSIVVDEFFVPALETISVRLSISNDIAGATLMAAGGSAPELFTSFIGTFQETDVGFAAIVGSAVFNVLFVIGSCAMISKKPLTLTWWPLARDCFFYSIGLAVLAVFFSIQSVKKIEWFESLILLIMYIIYVIFMKYNQYFYELIQKYFNKPDNNTKSEQYRNNQSNENMLDATVSGNHSEVTVESNDSMTDDALQRVNKKICNKKLSDYTFRAGMLNILLKDEWEWKDVASVSVVNTINGNVDETFKKLDVNGDGYLSIDELGVLLDNLNADRSQNCIEDLMKQLDINGDGKISFEEFSVWYIASEERILGSFKELFDLLDANGNGKLNLSEMKALLILFEINKESHIEIENIFNSDSHYIADSINGMTFEEFRTWFVKTEYYQHKLHATNKQAECAEGLKVWKFPESNSARFWFLITFPLVLLFTSTIPDVRKPGKSKYCYVAFLISIIEIGVFSYFMVEWTSILGDTLHIPLVVMALTFLAAGTSIPDLLSSMIVAKQGKGDMAVSSSIGSNIFDILVGLPLPWLSYSIINKGKIVSVNSDGLQLSVLILLGMLILVVASIIISKWKMTKTLGITMFILYFIFVAQDLSRVNWGC